MNPLEVLFSEEDKQNVKKLIEYKNPCNLNITESFNTIWYRDPESETELRILFLGDIKMTISRVAFKNKRVGTMTDIYNYLLNFCKEKGIKKIVVQSVETKEMADFCLKHNLQPNEYCMDAGDYLMGDYEFNI